MSVNNVLHISGKFFSYYMQEAIHNLFTAQMEIKFQNEY